MFDLDQRRWLVWTACRTSFADVLPCSHSSPLCSPKTDTGTSSSNVGYGPTGDILAWRNMKAAANYNGLTH